MARMLHDQDSTHMHLNATRRHTRLCNQTQGAEKFANAIQPAYEALAQKKAETEAKSDARQMAYDDLLLNDTDLDNGVRTLFEKCKQYDRNNPGAMILKQIFPEEQYGPIVRANMIKEPDLVEELVIRTESLGESHELFPEAAILRAKIEASRSAIEGFNHAVRAQKMAEAEEEISQAALRQQYEINYLDARKEFGRVFTERLFPQIGSRSAKVTIETDSGTDS